MQKTVDGGQQSKDGHSRADQKRMAARQKILSAVVTCLDLHGYAGASIARIQKMAGVSRGALTHHFRSKEDLMTETASYIFKPTLSPRLVNFRPEPAGRLEIESDVLWVGEKLLDTPEGRALVEILVATRTDPLLRDRIASTFQTWNDAINSALSLRYAELGLDDEVLHEIWTVARVFIRGLNTQVHFDPDPNVRRVLMRRFAEMIAREVDRHASRRTD